jgi:hypothetical protein
LPTRVAQPGLSRSGRTVEAHLTNTTATRLGSDPTGG